MHSLLFCLRFAVFLACGIQFISKGNSPHPREFFSLFCALFGVKTTITGKFSIFIPNKVQRQRLQKNFEALFPEKIETQKMVMPAPFNTCNEKHLLYMNKTDLSFLSFSFRNCNSLIKYQIHFKSFCNS